MPLRHPDQLFIDGKWVAAKSGKTFPVEDPATEETIAHVPAGEKADIDLAVAAARRAFETGPWSRISPADRSRLVWRLGDLLEQHIDEFAELGEFLAVPIRTYSAGMLTRLMFAVATAVNPAILLVDEVMGAADQNFQRKARKRMGEFIERSSIFVLASHTEELLKLYCNKIYTLSHGRLLAVS